MDKLFFFSLVLAGLLSAAISFVPVEVMTKPIKFGLFLLIAVCLVFQGWYGWQEKQAADHKNFHDAMYQDTTLRGQAALSEDLRELKDKEKKGLLTDSDYSLYITKYLESIDHTLKFRGSKNTREWVTTYYEEVAKIPSFFSLDDWKKAEQVIYDSMTNEINAHFSARGTFHSGIRPKLLDTFKSERERVVAAKQAGL